MKMLSKGLIVLGIFISQLSLASVYYNTATVLIKSGQQSRYFSAAQKANVIYETRKEPGNILYMLTTNPLNSRQVIFKEIWKTKADLDAHLGTPHMAAFFKSINFDPAQYNISVTGNGASVVFTPKVGNLNYVIEMLKLEGYEQ